MKTKISTVLVAQLAMVLYCFSQTNDTKSIQVLSARDSVGIHNVTLVAGERVYITDQNGVVQIEGTDTTKLIHISHFDYKNKSIRMSSVRGLNRYYLVPEERFIDEVVVSTGYQRIPRERATGSFAQMDRALLDSRPGTHVIDRLDGMISGLSFDGRFMGTEALAVRGASTISSNRTPLIILDNFPFEGSLDGINPDDIETITVLKDAAAASIWGARAANGVIVITSKKGAKDKPMQIQLHTNVTAGKSPELNFGNYTLPTADFLEVEKYLFDNGFYRNLENNLGFNVVTPYVEDLIANKKGNLSDADLLTKLQYYQEANVQGDMEDYFHRNPVKQQYTLSFKGGNQQYTYYLSGGLDRNTDFLIGNDYGRKTLNSSASFDVTRSTILTSAISFVNETRNENGMPFTAIRAGGTKGLYPYAKLADADGSALPIPRDIGLSYVQALSDGRGDWTYRPINELNNYDRNRQVADFRLNMNLSQRIFTSLSLDVSYQYQRLNTNAQDINSAESYLVRNLVNQFAYTSNGGLIYPIPSGEILDRRAQLVDSQTGRGQLSYSNSWDMHRIDAIAGTEIRQWKSEGHSNRLYGYNQHDLTYRNVDYSTLFSLFPRRNRQLIPTGILLDDLIDRFVSYYGNIAYNYNDRYTLSASVRKDASNLFGVDTNQKGVPLWSVGGAWLISKMDDYNLSSYLPYLKLRATYGYGGNVNKSLTRYATAYYGTDSFTGLPSAQILTPPNPSLRWERTATFNVGLDFELKDRILGGTFEYFTKNSTDLIGQAPLDPTTGFFVADRLSFIGNNAMLKTQGFDLTMTSSLRYGHFQWDGRILVNHQKNTVTDYQFEQPISNLLSAFPSPVESKSLYPIFSYPWVGLNPETGYAEYNYEGERSQAYADIRAKMTREDLTYHGSMIPTFTGGLMNTFRYGPASLMVNFTYSFGNYVRMPSINYTSLFSDWMGHSDYSKRWQKPGDENHTQVPALPVPGSTATMDYVYSYSSALVDRGGFVALRDLMLSYKMQPRANGGKIGAKLQAEFYLSASNLGLIWVANERGIDPRFINSPYQIQRLYTLGIRVKI